MSKQNWLKRLGWLKKVAIVVLVALIAGIVSFAILRGYFKPLPSTTIIGAKYSKALVPSSVIDLMAMFGTLIFSLYILVNLIKWLAERDIFFTLVNEGEAKAIEYLGSFHRVVFTYKNHSIDKEWNITLDSTKEELKVFNLLGLGGIHWMGIPPLFNIHEEQMSWASRTLVKDESGQQVAKDEPVTKIVKSVLLRPDIYTNTILTAECSDNIPLNVKYIIRAFSTNPYKTLYRVQHWTEAVFGALDQSLRDYVGTRSYSDLISKEADGNGHREGLINWLESHNIVNSISDYYGIKIDSCDIINVDPGSSEAEEFIRASTEEYKAKQKAKAAEQQAKAIVAIGEAKAKAIKEMAQAIQQPGGREAAQLRSIEALAEGKNNTVFISDSVKNAPGLILPTPTSGKTEKTEPGTEE